MLVSALGASQEKCQYVSSEGYPLHKRLPKDFEEQLFFLFEKRKAKELKFRDLRK